MKYKSIRNISFRKKMTLIFAIVCTFSTCISGILYYSYAEKEIVGNFKMNAKSLVSQLEHTLDTRLSAVSRRAFAALTNSSFMQPLGAYLSAPDDRKNVILSGEAANWLKDIGLGEPLVHSAVLYTRQGIFDDYTRVRKREFSFEDSAFGMFYQQNPKQAVIWLPAMKDEIFSDGAQVIPYVRRFTPEQYTREQAYLIIQLDQRELLEEILGTANAMGQIVITDQEGHYIAANMDISEENLAVLFQLNNGDWETKYSRDVFYGGEEYLISKGVVELNGWQVYLLKSKSELLDSVSSLQKVVLGLMAAMIGFSVSIVAILSKQLTSSLQRLAVQMNRMREGEMEARYYYPYRDEIGSLAKTFNYMADEIERAMKKQEEYIEILKEERDYTAEIQAQKRKAELRALQAQINPHFLYNTLNTITWMASDQGADEIKILSNSLGKFFRLSLSRGAEVISIHDEVEHIKSYLEIQKIRYAKIMTCSIEIEETLMKYTILKLVLQPLVENAIYHGIKGKEEGSLICITGRLKKEAGIITLTVEDEGVGIPKEQLSHINEDLEKGCTNSREGYGIYNVNERIKLYYGINYGLRYESEYGEWTKAILTIPVIEGEGV